MNWRRLQSKSHQLYNDTVNASKQLLLYDGIFEEILVSYHSGIAKMYQKTRNILTCKISKLLYQNGGFENNNLIQKQFRHYTIFGIMKQRSRR
jgi:hypothetical protein